ncbi:interleukin 17 receptor A1a [Parambassis ranga]|uniref:Interleukin 17 receptor A1a n=1 Tax=Parambassis ranga TaxID=210632 RepID=A0A6P7HN53_9TELE|nr:interleukin-17 receptor A-like [Parambassis ranga]
MNLYHPLLVLIMCVSLSSAVRILSWPPFNCSRQDVDCTVKISNCMDRNWVRRNDYTPSGPEKLQTSVTIRQDKAGNLHPVLDAHWRIRDDGSVAHLEATELHVLVMSTNQNLCVRYSFKERLSMRSRSREQWLFSANMVVLDPGQRYHVSVFNIPKPELDYSSYDVSTDVSVPGCQDSTMQKTQFCIERGSMWRPNISVSQTPAVRGRSALAVSFVPDTLCEKYMVIVSCSSIQHVQNFYTNNHTTLNGTFNLDKWPKSCCLFYVTIKPMFLRCGEDCTRQRRNYSICEYPTEAPDAPPYLLYTLVALGVVFICAISIVIFLLCRKPGKTERRAGHERDEKPRKAPLKQPPKVLVIYSQDHCLYKDIVLKLCAFLQAKCGTKVLVDLLDSTSVSMVGRLRWLEWQRQQLKNPTDKILVLCSPGVQAKWRAMCGQGRVTLKEDVLSPTDDMVTPFLNLFLPDMHQAGMQGKYLVAYFESISSEQDVPSVFDIAAKYSLMKHFEELYFRILDMEKYQPGEVNHIEGIGGDEYFNCASGEALKDAIDTFKAFQLENPDWFKKECVNSEDEVITEANLLIEQLQIPPVLECVPLIKEGLPVYTHEVEINENRNSIHIITPEVNTEGLVSSVAELIPVVNPECPEYPSGLSSVLTDHLYPHCPTSHSVCVANPVLNKPVPPLARQSWLCLKEEPTEDDDDDDEEEDSLLPVSQPSAPSYQTSSALQNSSLPESSYTGIQTEFFPSPEISCSQPVEIDEHEDLVPSGKGPSSGSDQGYISKMSSQNAFPFKEDPLLALARLQEELFQQNFRDFDRDPEEN